MTKTQRGAVVTFAVSVALAGCSSSGKIQPVPATEATLPEPSTTCPFGIRGARIMMTNTDDGVAIAIRAYGDVEEVRRRAHDAAAMYGPGAHRGLGHDGAHGRGQQHGLGLAQLGVPVLAEVQSTPDGAVILVRPKAPDDLKRMRAALVDRERRVRTGKCS